MYFCREESRQEKHVKVHQHDVGEIHKYIARQRYERKRKERSESDNRQKAKAETQRHLAELAQHQREAAVKSAAVTSPAINSTDNSDRSTRELLMKMAALYAKVCSMHF